MTKRIDSLLFSSSIFIPDEAGGVQGGCSLIMSPHVPSCPLMAPEQMPKHGFQAVGVLHVHTEMCLQGKQVWGRKVWETKQRVAEFLPGPEAGTINQQVTPRPHLLANDDPARGNEVEDRSACPPAKTVSPSVARRLLLLERSPPAVHEAGLALMLMGAASRSSSDPQ